MGETAPPPTVNTWWAAFNDPVLDELIATALEQNFSLRQGVYRIAQAQALLVQSEALLRPEIGLSLDMDREWERLLRRPDAEGDDSSDIAALATQINQLADVIENVATGTPGATPRPNAGAQDRRPPRSQYQTQYGAAMEMRWEADLWGRLGAASRAQAAEVAAAFDTYQALRLLLSIEVAQAYFDALEQRLQLALLDEQLDSAQVFLELVELRFLQGDASAVDRLQQLGQVAGLEAEIPIAQSRLGLLENRLDVLLGAVPDGQPRTAGAVPEGLGPGPLTPVGVPLNLLENRPDLRALRLQVLAADEDVAAAMADRLPRLTLTGALGVNDASSIDGGLTSLSAAAALFQPLLDWGRRQAAVDAARAAVDEALAVYTQGYLQAIEEVETTLWQEARHRELIQALERRETIFRQTLEEARVRYSLGVTDYLPVLTALQDLQAIQRDVLEEQRVLLALRIQLYAAIGGSTAAEPLMVSAQGADHQGKPTVPASTTTAHVPGGASNPWPNDAERNAIP